MTIPSTAIFRHHTVRALQERPRGRHLAQASQQPNTANIVAMWIQCLFLCPTLSNMSRSRPTTCAGAGDYSTDNAAPSPPKGWSFRPRPLAGLPARLKTGPGIGPKRAFLKRRSANCQGDMQTCALRGPYGSVRSTKDETMGIAISPMRRATSCRKSSVCLSRRSCQPLFQSGNADGINANDCKLLDRAGGYGNAWRPAFPPPA